MSTKAIMQLNMNVTLRADCCCKFEQCGAPGSWCEEEGLHGGLQRSNERQLALCQAFGDRQDLRIGS